ncbi:MAG TPA: DoxX family protein [Herpetosiphonaceae bacterium]
MAKESHAATTDLGLLALRLVAGGLMAGHGAQKLFGAFGGYGVEGTGGWLESLGLKPGKTWAYLAGGGEFGSGVLTALGFLHPLGPISMFGPMVMAWATVHTGKPIWSTEGGPELPLLYLAAATATGLTGPGRYSLDEALDLEVPMPLVLLTLAGVAAGIGAGLATREAPSENQEEQSGDETGDAGADTELASGA